MKQRRGLKPLSLALIAGGFLFIGSMASKPTSAGSIDGAPVVESLTEAFSVIEANYAGEVDYQRTIDSSLDGMLRVLDPHSNYYTKEEFLELRSQQQSEYFGIGASIVPFQGKVFIRTPFDNTPAARAGLRYGDQIVKINGQSTEGWSSGKVSTELKGPRGTQVVVGVARAGEAKTLEYTIARDAVALPSITNAYMIRPGIGYIALRRQFARTSGDEMNEAVRKLKQQGMNKLLFDLRENPGGLVQAALDICDMFLARGQKILTIKSRKGGANERSFEARNNNPETFPIVTLVNGNSASASEIVSGALQDHDRSTLVGEVTFGKGLVQTIFPIADGAGLTLTTAKYYTPSGRLIQRDYSAISRYNYYLKRDEQHPTTNNGQQEEFLTDNGQKVYGGGGITPNVNVKARRLTNMQLRLQEPIFSFVRELVNGQVAGLSEFKINDQQFTHTLQPNDFVITDKVIDAFKKHLAEHEKDFHIPVSAVSENLDYLKVYIRYDVAVAAYGNEVAQQVLVEEDPQVKKGLEEMARAKEFTPKPKDTKAPAQTAQK